MEEVVGSIPTRSTNSQRPKGQEVLRYAQDFGARLRRRAGASSSIPTRSTNFPAKLGTPSATAYSGLVSNLEQSEERIRLAKTYAAMTDDELQHLARHAESLTETAWEALEDELDRRDLEFPDEQPEPRQALDLRTLVTIRQFRDLPEALLAKGSLESAGIECFLRDENLVRLDWFISNFVGGVKLCVKPEDAEKARQLLDQPILEGLYVHGVGLYEQPRCPKCNSLDVTYQELDPAAYLSMAVNVPIPFHRDGWRCRACSAEWEDNEVPGTGESA